jgi:hypothetical protein
MYLSNVSRTTRMDTRFVGARRGRVGRLKHWLPPLCRKVVHSLETGTYA